jgi:hypothetical protein
MNRARALARALLLSYITVGYNFVERVVSIVAGVLAGSAALLGFALNSFFESLSGAVMVWRFRGHEDVSAEADEKTESMAAKLVGCTFVLLGAMCCMCLCKSLSCTRHLNGACSERS